jgi:Sporulation and spore germination
VRRVALVFALLLAGCGSADQRLHVYLVDDWTGRLVAVETAAEEPRALLRELAFAEPSEGLVSELPRSTKLESFVVRERVAYVALRGPSPPPRREFHVSAQIVYTLTEHPGIDAVVLRVNGRRCCVYTNTSPSRPWLKPLDRKLFAGWSGAPDRG